MARQPSVRLRLQYLFMRLSAGHGIQRWVRAAYAKFLLPATPPWSSGRSCIPFKQVLRFELAGCLKCLMKCMCTVSLFSCSRESCFDLPRVAYIWCLRVGPRESK